MKKMFLVSTCAVFASVASASAAIDTTAATSAITESLTAGSTVAYAGFAITGLFLGIAILKKATNSAKR